MLWYRTVYFVGRICVVIPFVRYCISYKKYDICNPTNKPCLIFCNHTTLWDHLFLAAACPQHMFFVAGEHLFRNPWLRILANIFVRPILRRKGSSAVDCVNTIKQAISSGANVWMSPEGVRSINGATAFISPATGKLVKESGAALITYRLHGGYLRRPRWCLYNRDGPMSGEFVAEYSPILLSKMSVDEINEAICKDLYVNAFEDQKKSPAKYTGKKLAEHLEIILYVCPECKRISTLHSHDSILFCNECGYSVRFTEYGLFEPVNRQSIPFNNITDWDLWQRDYLQNQVPNFMEMSADKPITSDSEQRIYKIVDRNYEYISTGCFSIFKDRLVFNGNDNSIYIFPFTSITGLSISLETKILFTLEDGTYYEIQSDIPRSAIKYMVIFRFLTGKPYY